MHVDAICDLPYALLSVFYNLFAKYFHEGISVDAWFEIFDQFLLLSINFRRSWQVSCKIEQ